MTATQTDTLVPNVVTNIRIEEIRPGWSTNPEPRMDPVKRKAWTDWLRANPEKQAHSVLTRPAGVLDSHDSDALRDDASLVPNFERHCCLGVATEQAAAAGACSRLPTGVEGPDRVAYVAPAKPGIPPALADQGSAVLIPSVQEYLGWATVYPDTNGDFLRRGFRVLCDFTWLNTSTNEVEQVRGALFDNLSSLNDRGATFVQIADIIDERF